MNRRSAHMIQRQVFELSAAFSNQDLDWAERASNYLHTIINPALQTCFDEMNVGDHQLVLEKLEIDLGSFNAENFEKEAARRLIEILSKRLKEYSSSSGYEAQGDYIGKEPDETQLIQRKEVQLISEAKGLVIALKYFMLKGCFPWWFRNAESYRFRQLDELFHLSWIQSLTVEAIYELKQVLQNSESARIRLVNHFTDEWLATFLEKLDLAGNKGFLQYKILHSALQPFPEKLSVFHQFFWMAWIRTVFANGDYINLVFLVEKISDSDIKFSLQLAKHLHEACIEKKNQSPFKLYAQALMNYFNKPSNEEYLLNESIESFPKKDIPDSKNENASEVFIGENIDEVLDLLSSAEKKHDLKEDDSVFTEAAGIVLLHPFFAELFSEAGIWEDKKWRSEESVFKAIQILSWLAFGETDLPEHRLIFLKVLAGLNIETPLLAQPPLTPEEKLTCTQLLEAVVAHWKALRNTSPDGLREAFLIRKGKLTKTTNGYDLIVERLAQDVLLSHLPWGYSMIKLPWMDEMLNITWI